ncbi:MAG: DnaA/Hda family protein, partial [Candidatus Bathyarchaeota archaeon]|nr:DnaA/Hda family protein [Candidatus Bathyarchaeota archaeon]
MDNVVLWRSVLSSLEERISRPSFVTWFRNTTVRTVKDNEIILSVPNIFVREWLQTKFDKDLLSSFQQFSPEITKIKYVISREDVSHDKKGKTRVVRNDLSQPKIDFYQNRLSGLNPRYSFSNFVVGNFNQLAHACAFSISKNMIESSRKTNEQKRKLQLEYNPLFVYSKVGLGKTHLLESIGNEVVNSGKKKKVKYVPCPNFTSDVISAIRGGSIEKLIKTYHQFDVLIIDDIEFIAGKE